MNMKKDTKVEKEKKKRKKQKCKIKKKKKEKRKKIWSTECSRTFQKRNKKPEWAREYMRQVAIHQHT